MTAVPTEWMRGGGLPLRQAAWSVPDHLPRVPALLWRRGMVAFVLGAVLVVFGISFWLLLALAKK